MADDLVIDQTLTLDCNELVTLVICSSPLVTLTEGEALKGNGFTYGWRDDGLTIIIFNTLM